MSDEDESKRLVEADALMAKGDLRGELIIVQCELARGGFSRERGIALRKREAELLTPARAAEWANLKLYASSWTFRRGYVDEATFDVQKFGAGEVTIWSRAPHLRWVRFLGMSYSSYEGTYESDMKARLERALKSGRVRYFSVEDASSWLGPSMYPEQDGDDRYRSWAPSLTAWIVSQTELVGRLRGLGLGEVDETCLPALSALDQLEQLEMSGELGPPIETNMRPSRLRLRSHDREAVRAHLSSPLASRVTDLEVKRIDSVIDTECAPRLEHLQLVHPEAQLSEFWPFFRSERFRSLRTLRLQMQMSIDDVRSLLAHFSLIKPLEQLDLRGQGLERYAAELAWLWDGHLLL